MVTCLAQRATVQIKGLQACRFGSVKQEEAVGGGGSGADTRVGVSVLAVSGFDEPDVDGVFASFILLSYGDESSLRSSVSLPVHNFPAVCHRSSGFLATGSCLSRQVATMTVARWEPGNKDIRCRFPLLACGHFIDTQQLHSKQVCVYSVSVSSVHTLCVHSMSENSMYVFSVCVCVFIMFR